MPAKRITRQPSQGEGKKVIVTVKGSDEFEDWFLRLAGFLRLPKSTLIEHALVAFASAEGFDEQPPER